MARLLLSNHARHGRLIYPGDTSPLDLGLNLEDYMALPGDQIVTVPSRSGYYFPNLINLARTAHPATGGRFGGYLILVAEDYLGVIGDLSGGSDAPNSHQGATWGTYNGVTGYPNVPTYPEQRIMFVGFKWIKGSHKMMGVSDVIWWYNDASYTTDDWLAQYRGAGATYPGAGNDTAHGNMKNIFGTPFRVEGVYYNNFASIFAPTRISWYGCDVHNCIEDGWFSGGLTYANIIGCQAWDITNHGVDPVGAGGDFHHCDGIQWTQGESNWNVKDSAIGGRILAIADVGNAGNSTFQRLWVYGTPGEPFNYGAFNHRTLSNMTIDTINTFATGQYFGYNRLNPLYWADRDIGLYNDGDGTGTLSNVNLTSITTHNTAVPAGVTVSGGILQNVATNPTQVTAHASNPANVWRAAHPYGDYLTYFGWS